MLFSLRIFFERANKTTNIVSWLGNVYRNSKWSSLSTQNIKPSFKFQLSTLYYVLFILVFINYSFWHNFPILQYFIHTPSNVWYILQDWLSYASLLLLSCIYIFLQKLDTLFSTFIPNFFLSIGSSKADKKLNSVVLGKQQNVNALSSSFSKNSKVLEDKVLVLVFDLQKTIYYLSLINSSIDHTRLTNYNYLFGLNLINVTNNTSITWLNLYFSTKNMYNAIQANSNIVHSSEDTYRLHCLNSNKIFSTELDTTSFLGFNSKINTMSSINLFKNLNMAKQNRWLWKSSLLSDKVNKDINKITHLKKLVNNSTLNDFTNSNNIWISNKINSTSNFLKIHRSISTKDINLSLLKPVSNFLSFNKNIDNYESSIMWTVKRFYFTQRMLYNTQRLENLSNKVVLINSPSLKFSIYEIYQTKLQHNYNYAIQNVSFYKIILPSKILENINPSPVRFDYSSNFNFCSLTSKELFSSHDATFIKFVFSNLFFKKNKISFFSII